MTSEIIGADLFEEDIVAERTRISAAITRRTIQRTTSPFTVYSFERRPTRSTSASPLRIEVRAARVVPIAPNKVLTLHRRADAVISINLNK